MHDIEPHHLWRDRYISSNDDKSPHYGRIYDEFRFTNRVYNYYIHPQWDEFGSHTLYSKIIYADYDDGIAIIELIGEWNDCLTNDILFLKQNIVDTLVGHGIDKFLLIMDNVMNFHGSDDCYYEEWFEDISEYGGYIRMINLQNHVLTELYETGVHQYVQFNQDLQIPNWRSFQPKYLIKQVDLLCAHLTKELY